MERQPPVQASMLVYLFADQFAEPAKGLTVQGAVAPRTGTKVNAKALVPNLYAAALMELIESGAVRVETIEIKKLFGKEKALALALVREPAEPVSALALRIAKSIQAAQKPEQRRVREVVMRVVGGRASTDYPWQMALAWTIGEAEASGFIRRPEQKPGFLKAMFKPVETITGAAAVPDCVDPLQNLAAAVRTRLVSFEQSLGADAPALRKEIEKGVDECTKRSDD